MRVDKAILGRASGGQRHRLAVHLVFRILSLATLSLVLVACDSPLVFTAGGKLSGSVTDPPATWQLDEESGLAQLESRPKDPYSINLAYVQLDGHLYIYAGNTRTNWVEHIEQNPLVRIRVDETIYPVRAVRVNDNDELTAFAARWKNGSVFQRDPMQFDEVWLYRLEARRATINSLDSPPDLQRNAPQYTTAPN
jgi:hypothetical protein